MSDIQSWCEEKRSAYLYSIIERYETDATKKKLFHELAASAEKQAGMWKVELAKSNKVVPKKYKPDARTRLVGLLLRCFSVRQLRFILSAMKVRGMSVYDSILINSHVLSHGAHAEQRHKGMSAAGNLRAAVFGVNDGLVSNMSLLLGLAGGSADPHIMMLSGIAGLLAGSCSMAAGEYISMRSQREFFEYQIALEREELELYPEEEAAELACIYQARGLPKAEAKALAERMISNPEKALSTLAREELGLNPEDLGSPLGAAFSSFVAFALGAAVPLAPFLFGGSEFYIMTSIFLTAGSLFLIGVVLSLFTNCNAFISGLRMLTVGTLAGCVTFSIGRLIGTGLA
jgi:vacuolar iron transporter family protein